MKQINFRVSDPEYEKLLGQANEFGIKSVPELCKQRAIDRSETKPEDRRSYQMLIQVRRLLNRYNLDKNTMQKINEGLDELWHI